MRREEIRSFFEDLFFAPKLYHYPLILILLPLSIVYGSIMLLRRVFAKGERFSIPVVSVGNLIVGGSGKTPFVTALALRYPHSTIVSRGYGRKSSGLVEVSRRGTVLATVDESGDEAMMMARSLPQSSVIVSEDRKRAIKKAISDGAGVVILDDGFNRVDIDKYDILLEPEEIANCMPFPAGPFREFPFVRRYADLVLRENRDFVRKVSYRGLREKMLLATAISRPERLEPYLPDGVVSRYYLPDHSYFSEEVLEKRMHDSGAESILATEKDAVKMDGFRMPLSTIELEMDIESNIFAKIDRYIKTYNKKKEY